ncbi:MULTISPECIES: hypothetical protein [unclassified Mesorhizobium]|nr:MULTISPECIES: hypothetical protein [unclassified Mesorhizobium]
MLTIVINLRFTQIRWNGAGVNKKGGQAAFGSDKKAAMPPGIAAIDVLET